MMANLLMASAQVDTFCLNNVPRNYFIENCWPDTEYYCIYHHEDGSMCGIGAPSQLWLCVGGARDDAADYGFRMVLDSNMWDQPHIKGFAAGKHTDSTIRVAGIALLYPKYHQPYMREGFDEWDYGYDKGTRIVEELLAQEFDVLRLQLMDTNMTVLASGTTRLEDSVGRPLFVFGKARIYEVDFGTHMYSLRHDIYEVYFETPVAVTDSFYLEAHFENEAHAKDNFAFSLPHLREQHFHTGCTADYIFPKFNWKAQGGYRSFFNPATNTVEEELMPDSVWFTIENACEEDHGYMLIFPILEVICSAPEAVGATPMGAGRVLLRWDAGQWGSAWEVSYGPFGTLPGEGVVLTTSEPSLVLSGISADTSYVAYIRSLCTVRDSVWSDWSDGVNFGKRLATETFGERVAVTLTPNPAGSKVLLSASAELTGMEAYTAAGTFYMRIPAGGREVLLDVAAWPAGTYLLVIDTRQGSAVRRLTVAR